MNQQSPQQLRSEPFTEEPEEDGYSLTTSTRITKLQEHAEGGFATVLKGFDVELKREVAVKLLARDRAQDPDLIKRFRREAEVTACLRHPGITPVYSRGEAFDGSPFFVMPFLEEGSFHEAALRFHRTVSSGKNGFRSKTFRDLLNRFSSACNTVAYAHSRGVIHRDLKPQNIMLGSYGETFVIDWGLVESAERTAADQRSGEQAVELNGSMSSLKRFTPQFASPEQLRGDENISQKSDIYSLGATLYELLTGRPPLEGAVRRDMVKAGITGDFPPPRKQNPQVPKALEAICLKAMSLNPEDRYASCVELADDIEAYLSDDVIIAQKETAAEKLMRKLRQRISDVFAILVGLSVVLVLAVLAIFALGERQATAERASRDRLRIAAAFAARVGGAELDRRWRILEVDARSPALIAMVAKLNEDSSDSETRRNIAAWVCERFVHRTQIDELKMTSLSVFLEDGEQVARCPTSTTTGQKWSFRAYFHGHGQDLPEGTGADPSPTPVLSPIYISESTHKAHITFTIPIFAATASENEQATEAPIGMLGMAVSIGDLGLFDGLGSDEVTVLVESRDYEVENVNARGLIIDHPAIKSGQQVHISQELTGALTQNTAEVLLLDDFVDPVDGYAGEAVVASIRLPKRQDLSRDSGLHIILHPK